MGKPLCKKSGDWRIVNVDVNGAGDGGLGNCQGDCDGDAQCASGYRCFERTGDGEVPSCNSANAITDWDYCIAEDSEVLWNVDVSGAGDGGLTKCEGDCDNDSQCASGLVCIQRDGHADVPGCGSAGGTADWDYC